TEMNARQLIALLLAFVCLVTPLTTAAPSRVLMRFGKRAAAARFETPEIAAASYGFLPYGALYPQFEGFEDAPAVDQ
ncbi:hypothetical protein PMAYCL1PPCAC_30482, partial [Pristionchus mayeri]